MKLQGNVSAQGTKGAIWQVLPVFGELLKGFEEARQRHLPAESHNPQYLANLTALSPLPTQGPARPSNSRRRQRPPVGKASARAKVAAAASERDIATPAATQIDDFAQSQIDERFNFLTLEKHFNHNLNAAWQKLDDYYNRTDATPLYRAAVFLHPTLKWRWFERHWESEPEWIAAARAAVIAMWSEYKH
jgi:hypothetical protein